jgi:hypothetical protein
MHDSFVRYLSLTTKTPDALYNADGQSADGELDGALCAAPIGGNKHGQTRCHGLADFQLV